MSTTTFKQRQQILMHPKLKLVLASALFLSTLNACDVSVDVETDSRIENTYRFATFNIAMGLNEAGEMAAALESANEERLRSLATVLQVVRPDVVLLTEFDFDPSIEAADLLNRNYLQKSNAGLEGISYAFSYRPTVNTGVNSGLDIDSNGLTDEPTDAWGFGHFPGQYGMLILSKYPIDATAIRSFQTLKWVDFPGALRPETNAGTPYYPDQVWNQLRLSSKNHVDIPIQINGTDIHFLVSHPTPPVFDGPEDRNGKRNHDELALLARYIENSAAAWLVDDNGVSGGLPGDSHFIIAGDLNADPFDGDAVPGAIEQLLEHRLVDSSCTPTSRGGAEASALQVGNNLQHLGDPAADTSDFNDVSSGNYRLDYLLPSRGITVHNCGVFWPASDEAHHEIVGFSDHRLVWLDIGFR